MKTIRIGSGAGYGGDRVEPAIDLIQKGNLDYIIFETLAERTVALAQKQKLKDKDKGYNPLLEYRFQKIFDVYNAQSPKIISNMGAANPVAAVKKVKEIAQAKGIKQIKIAAVLGDDITQSISKFYDCPTIETEKLLQSYSEKIISANAYIGCEGIVKALEEGADIVITGRVSDPSLTVAPLIYEFKKEIDDYEFLGKATMAGHLLECASQICGGYFADPGYKDVPEIWNIGFPIAEINEAGEIEITKLKESGGLITFDTVAEQMLYEIQDPRNYFTPDVIADISQVNIEEISENKVRASNITGHQKSGTLKVSVGYREGYLCESEISYGGSTALERARLAEKIIRKRVDLLGYTFDEIRFDYIGLNSLYKNNLSLDIIGSQSFPVSEVRLRVAARTANHELAMKIGQEVEALYTNGPAAGGGVRNHISEIISIVSVLIPEGVISQQLYWEEI